jgi:hypothetical protein
MIAYNCWLLVRFPTDNTYIVVAIPATTLSGARVCTALVCQPSALLISTLCSARAQLCSDLLCYDRMRIYYDRNPFSVLVSPFLSSNRLQAKKLLG